MNSESSDFSKEVEKQLSNMTERVCNLLGVSEKGYTISRCKVITKEQIRDAISNRPIRR